MNKQELIEKLNQEIIELKSTEASCFKLGSKTEELKFTNRIMGLQLALNWARRLNEPQKVKVPAFVAEWINQHCYLGKYVCLERFMCQYNNVELPTDLYNYYDRDKDGARDKIISAILDGYEVEEEPKYRVLFPAVKKKHGSKFSYLMEDGMQCYSDFFESIPQLTEKEIKAIDERYWPFAVPVEKV
jgi:hypothetical protein|nr:MAG TPA: Protein of unknown function (DUF1642) [Caudoviricetes sp.]